MNATKTKYKVRLMRGDAHVDTLAEASIAVRKEIERGDDWMGWIGSEEWYGFRVRGVGLVWQGRKTVARVSYNGRLWTLDGQAMETEGGR